MATSIIEEYLPKTAEYINQVFDNDGRERGGHHNYVVEQAIINAATPVAAMKNVELEEFDCDQMGRLKRLDEVK